MASEQNETNVNRRHFLKAAVMTAVAATATGAGAAVLTKNNQATPVMAVTSLPTPPGVQAVQPVAMLNQDVTDLLARLATSQAENVRLQAALDAAQRQLAALQETNDTAYSNTEALNVQLGEANGRIGVLSGLVALYEQLEGIDMGATLDNGLSAVSSTLADLLNYTPDLSHGLEISKQALADFEAHIPVLENGRIWLNNHMASVRAYYEGVRTVLETAVERVTSFLEMLNEWFQGILKWLPFGMGQRSAAVMQALTDLLAQTPNTINGLEANIAQPLAVWLQSDGEERPLNKALINPLRTQVFDKADKMVTQVQQAQTVYQTQLAEPTQTAVAAQRAIRDQIAQYRQQHQI